MGSCGSVVFPILIVLKIIVEVCEKRFLDTQILGGGRTGVDFKFWGGSATLRHPLTSLLMDFQEEFVITVNIFYYIEEFTINAVL